VSDKTRGVYCCGVLNEFSAWVYAHWDERLVFSCPQCGKKFSVCRGVVSEVRHSKKKVKK
jgi:hypothetical protein